MGNMQYGGSIQESLSAPSPASSRKGSRPDYNYTVYKQVNYLSIVVNSAPAPAFHSVLEGEGKFSFTQ